MMSPYLLKRSHPFELVGALNSVTTTHFLRVVLIETCRPSRSSLPRKLGRPGDDFRRRTISPQRPESKVIFAYTGSAGVFAFFVILIINYRRVSREDNFFLIIIILFLYLYYLLFLSIATDESLDVERLACGLLFIYLLHAPRHPDFFSTTRMKLFW
jgi:hypothetical protein